MKVSALIRSTGLEFDVNKPPFGEPALVAGNSFFDRIYADDGRDTGGRDYTRFSAKEMRAWVKSAPPGASIVPDIENVQWREGVTSKRRDIAADIRLASGTQIAEDMDYLYAAINAALSAGVSPDRLGIYGLCPTGFNVQNMLLLQQDMRPVQASNDFVFSFPVWRMVGRLHPVLYATTNSPGLWKTSLLFQKGECDRLGLPCVPFICPTYHPSAQPSFGKYVEIPFWIEMLNQCEAIGCPEVIAWQGYTDCVVLQHIEAARKWIDQRKPKNETMKVGDQAAMFPAGRKL